MQDPTILQMLAAPENIGLIKEALGLPEFVIPGEAERQAEYEEIQQLVNSSPITMPPSVDPMMAEQMMNSWSGCFPPEMDASYAASGGSKCRN